MPIGDVEGLKKLLLLPDADVNEKDDEHGETAVSWAAEYGYDETFDLLLQHSADIRIRDNYDGTPLSWAARNGHTVIVKRLLEKGANAPEPKDQTNRTPLSLAAQEGHCDIMKLLFDYHSEIDSMDSSRQTPLFFAAKNGHKNAVKLLIDKTANANLMDANGQTPLFVAAEAGQRSILSFLLTSQDLDPDTKNEQGRTPLSLAAGNGHESVAEFLLSDDPRTKVSAGRAVFVDSRDNTGRSSLLWAAGNGRLSVVHLLVYKGANYNAKTDDGSKILDFVDEAIDTAQQKIEEEGEDKISALLEIKLFFNELHPKLQKELQKETDYADRGYSAIIMHCLKDKMRIKPLERYHITTMLEGGPIRKAKSSKGSSCIWFHLPANNTLMAKLYEGNNNSEEDNVILESDNWTLLQHHAPEGMPHARYMNPTCKILPLR
ncbi:Ankyrin repeat domain-containing protein [Lachnellula hyalina]|uniref:Ankyrin repeat domain-containing protein n=1 Tax=Lachnellula hyalina TaxID=1316788 RepID=A0A8H8U1F7_9HELO|nr:Ankyrin repeat domain-containing protein [Lachnellula hyalina]TVY27892.1 Ankyrin repeat domain-containing protein [Lachnellula hyalina]